MRIVYLTQLPATDKKAWSGTISFIYSIISKKYEVIPIAIERSFTQKALEYILRKATGYPRYESPLFLESKKRKIRKALQGYSSKDTVIFAPIGSNLIYSGGIPEDFKVIFLSDATYHCLDNYYFFDVPENQGKLKNKFEQAALNRADAIIYASNWAKNDAMEYYNIPSDKIHVLPFGANLPGYEYVPRSFDNKFHYKLILVGVDWKRKGVEIAIDAFRALKSMNDKYSFEFTVVGVCPENPSLYEDVRFVGRLDKNNPKDMDRLAELYKEHDIAILPTIAEAAGIVFAEAAMFGVPTFTHATGGTQTYVEDGVTGRCLPLGSTGKDFADAIMDMLIRGKLPEYSVNARIKYERQLNYDFWMEAFDSIIESFH
ncbi:MAG: glycosyltransferase family 4 protein [Butyrivibrio sp.]|nr:glycosyltransferase family 4 protein [Butyrivibrio sp.]